MMFKRTLATLGFPFITTLSVATAQAGHPDHDINLHLVQETFRRAQNADGSQLQPDRYWTCSVYSALPHRQGATNAVTYNALRFERRGSGYLNVGEWGSNPETNSFEVTSSGRLENVSDRKLWLNPGGFIDAKNTHWVIRALDGALVLELTVDASQYSNWAPAVSVDQQKAFAYEYCVPSEHRDGDRRSYGYTMGWQFGH